MTRTKKILVTVAVAAAAALGTAGPALADDHATVTPQDDHATIVTPLDARAS
ncbi:hypothetical protein ACWD4J_27695 [Streptomyces sp. NPDC002577]